VRADKVQSLHEDAILARVDWSGIERKGSAGEDSVNEAPIGGIPSARFPVCLLNSYVILPWRQVKPIVDKDFKPQEPDTARIADSLL
jgi:hypothetical protein